MFFVLVSSDWTPQEALSSFSEQNTLTHTPAHTHILTHSLPSSFTHSLTPRLTHPLAHTHARTHARTHTRKYTPPLSLIHKNTTTTHTHTQLHVHKLAARQLMHPCQANSKKRNPAHEQREIMRYTHTDTLTHTHTTKFLLLSRALI